MGFIGFPQQQNPVSNLTNYRRCSVNNVANSSGAGNTGNVFTGGAFIGIGTTATAYAKAAWNSAFSQATNRTGAGIDLATGVGFAGIGMFDLSTTIGGQAIRIIVGDDSASTAPANSLTDAISTRGFGFEIYNDSGTRKIRLFCHNGTSYLTSSSLSTYSLNNIGISYGFWVKNNPQGEISLFFSQTEGYNDGPLPNFALSPVLTLANGPTSNTGVKRYVTMQAITDGVNNPNSANITSAQLDETILTTGV